MKITRIEYFGPNRTGDGEVMRVTSERGTIRHHVSYEHLYNRPDIYKYPQLAARAIDAHYGATLTKIRTEP